MDTNYNKKKSVALSSVLAGFFLTGAKFVVGLLTGSMGILSEAVHSLLDLAAAIMTYFAVKFGGRPADETHLYGHGKIESVSALMETGLLFITSIWIIYEAVLRLVRKNVEIEATWYAFAVIILAIVIDFSRSRALKRVARETNSQALEADALHFSSDIYSSAAVLIGLVFVYFGRPGADAIAAIAVAIFVALAGYRLGKRTIDVLVDKAPEGITDRAREIVEGVEGVTRVNAVRARPLGPNMFVEISVAINRKYSVNRAHEIIRQARDKIKNEMAEAEVIIHAESIRPDSETIVEKVQALAAKHNLAVHDVVVDELDGRQYISYDLEVPDAFTVKEAHDLATLIEEEIKEEMGGGIELNSHIEPLKNEAILSSNVGREEFEKVMNVLKKTDQEVGEISDVHNVLVRKIGEKYFVSFHCLAPADISLERVHDVTSRFEYLMKDKMADIKRVVIHVEPKQ
jgi:cation diffusion facilitator family transporter